MRFFRAAVTGAAADLQGFAQRRNPKRLCLSENWDVQKKPYIRIMYQINATNFRSGADITLLLQHATKTFLRL